MDKGFKKLLVYQKAYSYALEIHKISLSFPKFETFELGSQIRRATKSVVFNIAEGYGKRESIAEFKRFLTMAIGSCDEIKVQLEFCKDLGYILDKQYIELDNKCNEIGKMLHSLHKNWQKFN